jgi:SEC-C motif
MTIHLRSDAANALLRQLAPLGESVRSLVDGGRYSDAKELITERKQLLTTVRDETADDAALNDLYITGLLLNLLTSYCAVWEQIAQQQFAASWVSLQNALETMRAIKRLSAMDLRFLEEQLINLERAYPYSLFFSIGVIASRIECSLCGKDIDSLECSHRRGHLYGGRMAVGIIRECTRLDHVSMVTNPEDKRCVVTIADASEQFRLVRYIGDLIAKRDLIVSEFDRIVFTQRRIPNPAYQTMNENEPCFCGSGKKFKLCCVDKAYIHGTHAEVHARRQSASPESCDPSTHSYRPAY